MPARRALGRDERRSDSGASLVEFAIIAPLLVALLLGMITVGLALSTKNSITNAVREATRLGATLPEGTDWSTDWAVQVKDRALELAGDDLDGGDVCAQIVSVSTSGETVEGSWPSGACPLSSGPPATPSSATAGSCVVKVWAERSAELQVLFFARSVSLKADALGLYERTPCP